MFNIFHIDEINSHDDQVPDSSKYNSFRTLFNVGWGLKAHTIKHFDPQQELEEKLKNKQLGIVSSHHDHDAKPVEVSGEVKKEEEEELGIIKVPINTGPPNTANAGAVRRKHGAAFVEHGAGDNRQENVDPKHHMFGEKGERKLTNSASVCQILFMTEGKKLYLPSKGDAANQVAALAAAGITQPVTTTSAASVMYKQLTKEEKEIAYEELQARLRCHRIVAQEV